ncbi:MAG: [FeFe] hydrogenase H-cluster radical SAM maturase HydE [Bacteroidales bacterium]|nr:[FeFe] hydrogenase H-cluster radical SAM maturase HydE [Bacteroidales bacterium]
MKPRLHKILSKKKFEKNDIVELLSETDSVEKNKIRQKAYSIKRKKLSNAVYFRGLIEYSNICSRNCFYCGVRAGNTHVNRYQLSDKEVLEAVDYAWKNKFASIVIQSGERKDNDFVRKIDNLLKKIKQNTNNEIGITLSCGEQSEETYKKWFESGAHRYLLRIETTNEKLFNKIHPVNEEVNFASRLKALELIKKTGYQTGTGVMIGLPFQLIDDLANDLMFFKDFDIDMVGMGPYIECNNTPLSIHNNILQPLNERFELSLLMISVLRIMMKDINIASSTALQAIHPMGREKGLLAGANVIMPNITPLKHRVDYLLYKYKPGTNEKCDTVKSRLENNIKLLDEEIAYGKWGDSKHFFAKRKNKFNSATQSEN